ncbi:TonB-dependent receptor plug domain-containing protein [Patiriisocius marinus]|uniref:TonB-dependent receptor plug domain-containing protein n=1 Tax=Patiriisocius marinus TaxID=1397112 RepID=UPI0023312239|nr:TonB-dependent receptor plug domain-containing protein [Patiriisocius marinus]
MNVNKSKLLFIFQLFILTWTATGQVNTERFTLPQVLAIIENRYNVTFSYMVDDVSDLKAKIPSETLKLEESLIDLELQLPLTFLVLKNTIAIQKRSDTPIANQALDEVLITQYLARGITLKTNGTVDIKPKEFEIIPGLSEPDVLASVKSLPGISSTDESVTNLNIRGGTNDQNLILWDGIKMYQSGHFFGMISAFDPYNINKINITKNGTSASMGDGVSGTIDMILDQNPASILKGSAGFNLLQGSSQLEIPITKKLGVHLSARRSITDVLETATYKSYFDRVFQDTEVTNKTNTLDRSVMDNQKFYFYDISGKLLYNISDKDKISASFITINNEFNFLEQAENSTLNQTLESGLKQQNNAGNLIYKRQWNNSFQTKISGYLSNYKLSGINFDINNNQRLDQFNEVLDLGLKLDGTYSLSTSQKLLAGYQFNETGVTNAVNVNAPPLFNFIKSVLRVHAIYAEYSRKNETTNIAVGFRATTYPKLSETFIEPRLNASWQLLDNFRLHLLGELKHQSTSQIIQQSNDFLGIIKRRWVIANNDDVAILQSQQVSLGSTYNYNKWLISVEGYFKYVKGINSRSQGFRNQFQFVNTNGEYQVKGIDFLIQKRYKSLRSWLGYSVSKNTYTFDELNNGEAFDNSVDMRHAITFNNSYTFNKLSVAIGFNWHTGIPTTTVLSENQSPVSTSELQFNSPNGDRLASFFRTDVALHYSLKISKSLKSTIGLSIWNVLNQKQTIDRYYANIDGVASQFEQESLGLTPNVSVRLYF